MDYKVVILAAGKGTRVSYSKIINKALLPVGDKSNISHIIDKFPMEIEIVIPVGYKASQLKDFIALAHPERKVTFVDVDNWEGPGSGPGYSLLACKPHLDCPFIFTSCDTIVLEDIPTPFKNWIGVASVPDSKDFCVAEVENNAVTRFFDKVDTPTLLKIAKDFRTILNHAFIGMAAVRDYRTFWESLEGARGQLIRNELQVSNGLSGLIQRRLEAMPFTWFDTGSEATYEYTNRYFNKNRVLTKSNEFIYFESDKVIKYFADVDKAENRMIRARILNGLVPEIVEHRPHFYSYKLVDGVTLPESTDKQMFSRMLEYYKKNLWKKADLSPDQRKAFRQACDAFYQEKTKKRLSEFYERTGIVDEEEVINGVPVPTMASLFERIDWKSLAEGVPVLFHGDFQPENIIVRNDGGWTLIDWREEFGKIREYGDIYYDFGKMYHALIICGAIIRDNQFRIEKKGNIITYDFLVKSNLLEFKEEFSRFIEDNGYDIEKVRLLSALIYLNIAPLHHTPYNMLLYYLGKLMTYEILEGKNGY
jgi:NDP-sugar pyrophosphorylase family protein